MANILFYDFEVFRYDWLVVITDPSNQKEHIIINNKDELQRIYDQHKKDIWVGFNCTNYDRYILAAILCDFNPYEVSDWIINKDLPAWKFSSLLYNFPLITFDCMIGYHGLKTLEAFMGESIEETAVSFDIDRKLTPNEIDEEVKYCQADVQNTMKVFAKKIGEFNGYLALLRLFKLPLTCLCMTKAQLVAEILGAKKLRHNDEFDIQFPPTLQVNKYTEVLDFYKNNWNYDKGEKWVKVCGVWHKFGTGGIHGAEGTEVKTNKKTGELEVDKTRSRPIVADGNILHVDVKSYYPSLNVEYPEITLSRNIPDPTKVRQMRDERLKYKAEGKTDEAYGLKIAINAIGGATKLKTSKLYDPRQNNNMCIAGQVLLLDLLEKLEGKCRILQSNTDGIILQHRGFDKSDIIDICHEWEKRTRMELEYHDCKKLIQKDINNYLLIFSNGKIDAKGAYVKDLNELDYELAIVNKAIKRRLIDGIPVEKTINECNDLSMFQQVVKLRGNFVAVIHNGSVQNGRTFRVFASVDNTDTEISRVREIGGNTNKFANTPEHCFIDNSNIAGKPIPNKLDREWYIKLANDRVSAFLE